MEVVWVVGAFVCFITGLMGAFLPVIPGPPLTFAGLLLLYGTELYAPPLWVSLGAGLMMALITVADYVLPVYFTRRFKSSPWATRGATVGMVVGLFLFPPWGILLGPVCGAFVGEWLASRSVGQSLRSAWASLAGFFSGMLLKLAYGVWGLGYAIWLYLTR
ncbi:MAG: DUF456 domain-containing protein [Flavobacteriales bacterium]|nr:DUF456 domain-containing protein [Flavobacteriales bacterium]MCX7650792.1 DUF456 domain-containing protein [Flavobacteriales bacterium]MDW8431574.1 DUF456 domain-containing protein [Flavobacteriales bacterium]